MSRFMNLGINEHLENKLKLQGIFEPTPIQAQAIPTILSGKDLIAKSQTGTGKTLAFLLPILERIDGNKPYPQALILTPTRELALQITEDAKALTADSSINILAAYGGQDVLQQVNKLKKGIQLIIATPGRLLDHLERKTIDLGGIDYLVLDEADEMITMGFGRDLEQIIFMSKSDRQTMLFSATITGKVRDIGRRFMKKPAYIEIKSENVTLDNIEQIGIRIKEDDKSERLMTLIDEYNPFLMLVFCRTKDKVTRIYNRLKQNKYNVDQLHGDLSQNKRERIMKSFREAEIQVLIATDLAARGIDVDGITHVVNYDLPGDSKSYIHRIGRTGRIGNEGIAISFVTEKDRDKLYLIERDIKEKIKLID